MNMSVLYRDDAHFNSVSAQKRFDVINKKFSSIKWEASKFRQLDYLLSCFLPFTETIEHIYSNGYTKEEKVQHMPMGFEDMEATLDNRAQKARVTGDPCHLWDWVTCSASEAELRQVIARLRAVKAKAESN